jgi:spermidine/putrescine transport system ATP-binding protein
MKLRKEMQLELKQIQQEVGITFIYVTHDQEEAMTMSDRIAVMSDGLVQQIGAPRQIYEHPATRFVADFIGETNFVRGAVTEIGRLITIDAGELCLRGSAESCDLAIGQTVSLAVRPEKINLYRPDDEIASREDDDVVVPGTVRETIYIGTDTRYRVALSPTVELVVRVQNFGARDDVHFQVGDALAVQWPAENALILVE